MEKLLVGELGSFREKDPRSRGILVSLDKSIHPNGLAKSFEQCCAGGRMMLVDDSWGEEEITTR